MGHTTYCRPMLIQFGAFLLVVFTGTRFSAQSHVQSPPINNRFSSLAATAQVVTIAYPKAAVGFDEGNKVDITVRVSSSRRCPQHIYLGFFFDECSHLAI